MTTSKVRTNYFLLQSKLNRQFNSVISSKDQEVKRIAGLIHNTFCKDYLVVTPTA